VLQNNVTHASATDFRLKIWGARGAIPTPVAGNLRYGGNTSCLEIRCPGVPPIIIDGGSGIRDLGAALMQEFPDGSECHVFFTHFHWDHIQGLPYFAPVYHPGWRLNFHSVHEPAVLERYLTNQMCPPYFPVTMPVAQATFRYSPVPEAGLHIGALRLRRFPLEHPNGAHGYRIDAAGRSIAIAFDHEHGNEDVDRGIVEHAAGADVLIYDAQYTVPEYDAHKGWGHSTWEQAVRMAKAAGVRQLVLFHHDPTHSDEVITAIVELARQQFPDTVAATEGSSISFDTAV
jgi:phosphoribosyl 1,2-cyclic phosphodiesterase